MRAEVGLAYEEAYLSLYAGLSGYLSRVRELEDFSWRAGHRWGAECLQTESLGELLLHTIMGFAPAHPAAGPDEASVVELRRYLVAVYRTVRRMRPCGLVVSAPEGVAWVQPVRS